MEIDGVFSGGGMKGYAMIGAISEAEKRGLKFKRVAGTSAGSIIAAFIAAGFTSKEIYQIFIDAPRKSFMDSGFLRLPFLKWLSLYWKMGLYKGDAFEIWLEKVLAQKNVWTFSNLAPNTLKIIVSDVTNNQLAIIPDDLPKYGIDPDFFPVAKAIRMSTSMPYVFRPVKFKKNLFVDGGLLSNFPIWVFDNKNEENRPILGIQLTPKEKYIKHRKIKNSIEMFSAIFETLLNAHDLRYISRKIEQNIIFIKLNESVTTDFAMDKKECDKLVETGKNTAKIFFDNWQLIK